MSHKVKAYAKKNEHRLKLHFTPKYTPNNNKAEAQWPSVKAAVANKQIRSRDHIAATIGGAFDAGEITPVTPHSYTRVTTRRVDRKEAGEIEAKIGEGEYFCYRDGVQQKGQNTDRGGPEGQEGGGAFRGKARRAAAPACKLRPSGQVSGKPAAHTAGKVTRADASERLAAARAGEKRRASPAPIDA